MHILASIPLPLPTPSPPIAHAQPVPQQAPAHTAAPGGAVAAKGPTQQQRAVGPQVSNREAAAAANQIHRQVVLVVGKSGVY